MCFYENLFRIHKINFKTYSSRNTRDVTDYTHYSGLLIPSCLQILTALQTYILYQVSLNSFHGFLSKIFETWGRGFCTLPALLFQPYHITHYRQLTGENPTLEDQHPKWSTKPPPALLPKLPTRLPTVTRCSEDQCGVISHFHCLLSPRLMRSFSPR